MILVKLLLFVMSKAHNMDGWNRKKKQKNNCIDACTPTPPSGSSVIKRDCPFYSPFLNFFVLCDRCWVWQTCWDLPSSRLPCLIKEIKWNGADSPVGHCRFSCTSVCLRVPSMAAVSILGWFPQSAQYMVLSYQIKRGRSNIISKSSHAYIYLLIHHSKHCFMVIYNGLH